MRILSWLQDKLNVSQEKKKSDFVSCSSSRTSIPDDRKEEFNGWPQCILSIGTFGNTERKEEQEKHDPPQNLCSLQDLSDFSPEEVTKIQKELTKLLKQKPKSSTDGSEKGEGRENLPLHRFLNCPSNLEAERRDCGDNIGNLSPNSRVILNKVKDILADKNNAIKQKSLSFLLKKMFVCRNGFSLAPSIRDQLPESRMEKLLRILLQEKIYQQGSNKMAMKKYFEKKPMDKVCYKDEMRENEEEGSKWVKTDSEYIVLEI